MLFDKYTVKKNVGETDTKAEYFVLRIDKDPHARVALRAYSRSIQDAEPGFAGELMGWADRCEAAQHQVERTATPECPECGMPIPEHAAGCSHWPD